MCQQRLSGPKHRHQRESRASGRWRLALSWRSVTKEYESSWILEPHLTCANVLRQVQHPAFALVSALFASLNWSAGADREQSPARRVVQAGRTVDGATQVVRPPPRAPRGVQPALSCRTGGPERAKALQHLWELAKDRTVTLLTATKRPRDQRGRGACRPAPGLPPGSTCRLPPSSLVRHEIGDARAGTRVAPAVLG
jgi:hypothetical protein